MAIINFYKPPGWAPLECIQKIRKIHPKMKDLPITYAGRLDPMAEGVIVLLSGEDRLQKELYQHLSKSYQATFLFGLSSDTYDALGIIQKGSHPKREAVEEALLKLSGKHVLPFPHYSSFKVQGKPLHWWAQQQRLHEIQIPVKKMVVTQSTIERISSSPVNTIRSEVFSRIDCVTGDFRQETSKKTWNQLKDLKENYTTAIVNLDVLSGTYVRSLAQLLGTQLGCGALLLSLTRSSVGPFLEEESEHI